MWRHQNRAPDQAEQSRRIIGEDGDRIGIEYYCPASCQRRGDGNTGPLVDARTRADEDRIASLVAQQAFELFAVLDFGDQIAGFSRLIDRHCRARRRNSHESCTSTTACYGGEPRGASSGSSTQEGQMSTGIFVRPAIPATQMFLP